MPDSDDLLGQNEVDVRNEARNPLNAMPLDNQRRDCHCKPWQQRWRAEAPHRCTNCGGLFDSATVPAREFDALNAATENAGHQAEDTHPDREKD